MNILITGGLGHIGSYFLNNFSGNYNYSHKLIRLKVVDNLLTHRYATLFDMDRDITFLDKDMDNLVEEDIKGTVEVGKLADLTVFSKDIMKVPEEEIIKAQAVMTIVNGQIVFEL